MAGYIGSKAVVVSSGAERKKVFTITADTTSLTGLAYTPGQVHVFHNGIRLVEYTDYVATDGSTISLLNDASAGDEVVVVSYATFSPADTYTKSEVYTKAEADAQFLIPTGVTAGSGLIGGVTSGTVTLSHADTSAQGSVDNSGNTVIQDITLDTYGHITGINSATIPVVSGYTAKAWVNYNLVSASVRDSENVSSVTDLATGEIRVNLTNPMSSSNYASFGSAGDASHGIQRNIMTNDSIGNTSSSVLCVIENSSASQVDTEYVGVSVIGDLA